MRRRSLFARLWLLCALALLWRQASLLVCKGGSCYRLGNFLDFWLQRELLQSLDAATAGPANACNSILRGITFRRALRLELLRPWSLIERISASRLPQAPTAEFWNDASSAPLRKTLQEWDEGNLGASFPFVWWRMDQLKLVLPYLKPALRPLIDAPPEAARVPYDDTCVVHFRTGDFFNEQRSGWNQRQLHLSIATLIAAARTLPRLPQRFEVLGGGIDHNCDVATADCGASTLRLIELGLRHAYPSTEVVLVGGSADDDFVRAARAPMLLIGCDGTELKTGSSFVVYAAAASDGHVRSPACFLRFAACMANSAPLTPRWLGYPHPNCKECREDLRTDQSQWAIVQAALEQMGTARVPDNVSVSAWIQKKDYAHNG